MGKVSWGYVSDHTRWMNELLEKNPAWAEAQKTGRALWWDKKQDIERAQALAGLRIPQKPYPYDVNFHG